MTTYCILCRQRIPPDRQRKKAITCSNECRKEYRRQYRLELAQRVCRICGRRKRRSLAPEILPMLERPDARAQAMQTILRKDALSLSAPKKKPKSTRKITRTTTWISLSLACRGQAD